MKRLIFFVVLTLSACAAPLQPREEWVCIGVYGDQDGWDEAMGSLLRNAGIPDESGDGSILYSIVVPKAAADRASSILLRHRRTRWDFIPIEEFRAEQAQYKHWDEALAKVQRLRTAGDLDGALQFVDVALRIDTNRANGYRLKVQILMEKEDKAAAIRTCEGALGILKWEEQRAEIRRDLLELKSK